MMVVPLDQAGDGEPSQNPICIHTGVGAGWEVGFGRGEGVGQRVGGVSEQAMIITNTMTRNANFELFEVNNMLLDLRAQVINWPDLTN
jgi:hypothetical protein